MADILENKQLLQYVKEAVKLESSYYSQSQVLSKMLEERQRLKYNVPQKKSINKPIPETIETPNEPIRPEKKKLPSIFVLLLVLGCLFSIGGIALFFADGLWFAGFLLLVVGIFEIVVFVGMYKLYKNKYEESYSKYVKDYAKYKEEMKTLDERREQAEFQYNKEYARYEESVEENEKSYTRMFNNHQEACTEMENSVDELNKLYYETKGLLERLYGFDVIFPKYRNMVAMATILEYLESGRCSELKGQYGAYNLYESELLQNRIIDKLDTVISQLEQVKANQYILYTEIQKANQTISYIAQKATQISDATRRIEAHSAITSFYSQITAANTEALAYIECFK